MSKVLMLEDYQDGDRPGNRDRAACGTAPRLMLVANNRMLRDALEAALLAAHDLEVLVAAETIDDLPMAAAREGIADALLMDVGASRDAAIGYVRELVAGYPRLKIIIIDVDTGDELLDLLEAGASALLLKRATVDEILRTTWTVLGGTTVIPASLTRALFARRPGRGAPLDRGEWRDGEQLTRREQQIGTLIADGLSNKEIATTLNIATFTVKSHVHNVLQKMGLQTRAQVARHFLLR